MVVLFLDVSGTSMLFSIVPVPFYIPTNSGPISPHAYQHLHLLSLITVIVTGMRRYLIVVLGFRNVEHFFLYLLATCMSSLEKPLFRS